MDIFNHEEKNLRNKREKSSVDQTFVKLFSFTAHSFCENYVITQHL